jgi:hypothetical protein
MRRPVIVPTTISEVLRSTNPTLGTTIGSVFGAAPTLKVVAQWRLESPHPSWVSPPFGPDDPVLGRCTGYRLNGAEVSHNLAYVNLRSIHRAIADGLESGRVHLGELFLDPAIEKWGFEFGTDDAAPDMAREYEHHLLGQVADLDPYVWRRYIAGTGGSPSFIVVEALPIRTWASLLAELGARGAEGAI